MLLRAASEAVQVGSKPLTSASSRELRAALAQRMTVFANARVDGSRLPGPCIGSCTPQPSCQASSARIDIEGLHSVYTDIWQSRWRGMWQIRLHADQNADNVSVESVRGWQGTSSPERPAIIALQDTLADRSSCHCRRGSTRRDGKLSVYA